VFEKVLTLASRSAPGPGAVPQPRHAAPAASRRRRAVRVPHATSENVYVFRHNGELTMIDAGHGIYYKDFTGLLRKQGLDPRR